MPAALASSIAYWISGLSTTVSISFGIALVAGRKRVPSPATGNTALRTRFGIDRRPPYRPPELIGRYSLPFGPAHRKCGKRTGRLHPPAPHGGSISGPVPPQ